MDSQGTLLLNRSDVAALLTLGECIEAVEQAFKAHAEWRSLPPGVLGVHAKDGGFHIKFLVVLLCFSADARMLFHQETGGILKFQLRHKSDFDAAASGNEGASGGNLSGLRVILDMSANDYRIEEMDRRYRG